MQLTMLNKNLYSFSIKLLYGVLFTQPSMVPLIVVSPSNVLFSTGICNKL